MGRGGSGGTRTSDGGAGGAPGMDGGSIGDPHVFTPDGLKYDFQAVGEFVLVEDTLDPTFFVQVRQEPFYSFSTLSVNTAVAASVDCDRVAFYAGKSSPVRVNGVPWIVDRAAALPHGGRIESSGEAYVVTWPTGEQIVVVTAWKELLNVSYRRGDGPKRHLRGLLGTHDGKKENDLTTRSGSVLHYPPSPDDLYRTFGESYRITASESLFDYAPGKSTSTFTDRGFPHAPERAAAPAGENLTRARKVCVAEGVTDQAALEACTVDVAVTGDLGFARAAAATPRDVAPLPSPLPRSPHRHFGRALDTTPTATPSVEPHGEPCPRSSPLP